MSGRVGITVAGVVADSAAWLFNVAGSRRDGLRSVTVVATAMVMLAGLGATRASAATLSVCPNGCAYTQIAPAIAAASSGDTVTVAGGTYHGGFAIDKDLTLRGAGAHETTIRGGGPVITVGKFGATTEPTVAIRGVTITGGATHSSLGQAYTALGGGVWVPPAANFGRGATVRITRSVITHNIAAPATSIDAGIPCGPSGECRFAHAGGGGIASWGTVTLERTIVSHNEAAGAFTSDADGAGIYIPQGGLIVDHSVVTDNRAIATTPNGRFAEGGGIMVDTSFSPPGTSCTLVVRDSVASKNQATLTSTLPSFAGGALIEMSANAGGIHVGDDIPTTVVNTAIDDNSAAATDPQGEASAIDAGVNVGDSPLVMRNTRIDGNRSATTSATTADVGATGDAIELDGGGTITNTRIIANRSTSVSPTGAAAAAGALGVFNFNGDPKLVTVKNSVISGNVTDARSATGSATVLGGGVFNNSLLLMRNVRVNGNVARAQGPNGAAQGGGIWNGVDVTGPPVHLTLTNSRVTRNRLAGSSGISLQGGGLFTTTPVTLTHTRIARNHPDQCAGC